MNASLTKILLEATGEWNSVKPRWLQVAQFRRLIDSNTVLGYDPSLVLSKYVKTPIIAAMGGCDDFGAVSVSVVGSSLGKTTAANVFLRKNKRELRGLAFCRTKAGIPYASAMLELLGLNPLNAPKGWLRCLIDALIDSANPVDKREPVMILDEFICEEADYYFESSLIMTLKAAIRNTRIRVIVLTPSESFADFLVSKNNLMGIVPLNGTYGPQEWPDGKWKNMSWSLDTCKVAARQLPLLSHKSNDEIDEAVHRYYNRLTDAEKNGLAFLKMKKFLEASLGEPKATLTSDNLEWQIPSDLDSDPGCAWGECNIS